MGLSALRDSLDRIFANVIMDVLGEDEGGGTSTVAAAASSKEEAAEVVDRERLHRKSNKGNSQVVRIEPKEGISESLVQVPDTAFPCASAAILPKADAFALALQPATKRDAGQPTCLEVRSRWIVIGMSHGQVKDSLVLYCRAVLLIYVDSCRLIEDRGVLPGLRVQSLPAAAVDGHVWGAGGGKKDPQSAMNRSNLVSSRSSPTNGMVRVLLGVLGGRQRPGRRGHGGRLCERLVRAMGPRQRKADQAGGGRQAWLAAQWYVPRNSKSGHQLTQNNQGGKATRVVC